jgi:hypothetical protein
MSIAELIMQGTNRASESTSWVGDSLAKLGQNVGAALAQKEQQKQAQAMLPFLQQSMQESMTLAGSGKTGEAYAKLMPFITNPAVINDPNLMPAVDAALKLNQLATNDYLKKEQLRVREDMYNARYGGGGGGGLPAGPQAFFNTNPADTEPLPTDQNLTQPVDEMPQGAGATMPGFTGNFNAGLNEPIQNQGPIEPSPEVKKSFENNEKAYSNATPQQQQTFQNNLSSTTIPQGTNVTQFDFSNIKSLRNVVGIASPVEMQIEVPESLSITENDKGKSYLTKFNKKTTNQNVIDKSNELVLKSVPNALAVISSNETLSKYFEENDLGKLDIGAKKEDGELSYYIGVRGKKDSYIPITEPDYENAKMIRNLPASAKTLDSAFIITQEPAAEAPAPAQGGIPATQFAATSAVEIPEEAMELQKIVEQGKAAKAKETEKNVDKRIQDIDAQIKRLASPTTIAYDQAGLIAVERPIRKTPEEAQADIEKIAKLKAEKDALQGKPSNQKEIKEGDIVVQNKKRYKFTNGKPVLIN